MGAFPARILLLAACLLAVQPFARADDWPMFGRNPAHTSFSTKERGLDHDSLALLASSWTYSSGTQFAVAPTVVQGTMYFGGWNGYFYAVNVANGNVLWRVYVGVAAAPDDMVCQQSIGVTSQAAISGDIVYVGGGDSAVYALNRSTGDVIWRVPLADPASGSYIWSSITLAGDHLYVGLASLGDCPLVRGGIARIDLNDPEHPLMKYLVPEDQVGAGIWSTPAVDLDTNTVYVTTGTGEQDADAGVWGGTLLALDGTTLEIRHHFFLPTNSLLDDIEWGSSPVVFTDTGGRKLVGASGKDGILYVLRATDLSLLYQVQLAVKCICPECGCGSLSTPAFDGQLLYSGAGVSDISLEDEGTVYALDPGTGAIRWSKTTAGTIIAPVTVANSLVFVASTKGLNIFDARTGDLLWTDNDWAPMYSQPVLANGSLYCTYVSGDVVAWRVAGDTSFNSGAPPGGRGRPPSR